MMQIEIFKEVYTSTTLAEEAKIVLSDDNYAIGELIAALTDKIEHLRLSWLSR